MASLDLFLQLWRRKKFLQTRLLSLIKSSLSVLWIEKTRGEKLPFANSKNRGGKPHVDLLSIWILRRASPHAQWQEHSERNCFIPPEKKGKKIKRPFIVVLISYFCFFKIREVTNLLQQLSMFLRFHFYFSLFFKCWAIFFLKCIHFIFYKITYYKQFVHL